MPVGAPDPNVYLQSMDIPCPKDTARNSMKFSVSVKNIMIKISARNLNNCLVFRGKIKMQVNMNPHKSWEQTL